MRKTARLGWMLLLGSLLLAGGCGDDEETPRTKTVEGRVSEIDTKSGTVKMLWTSPKMEKMELEGTLAPEAEILINGRTAELSEVQTGDKVRVVGRIEKEAGETKLVAVKVEIDRTEDGESSTRPAQDQENDDQETLDQTSPETAENEPSS